MIKKPVLAYPERVLFFYNPMPERFSLYRTGK